MPIADLPQSNKQHAVPQNIMDVEFKLIGDLTMRQFVYLILSAGLAYLCFIGVPGLFKIPLTLMFAILGIGLAFIPINERGMDQWVVNFFKAISTPTQRYWRKDPTIPSAFLYDNLRVVQQELITLAPTSSRRKLEEFLKYSSDVSPRDPLDIPIEEYALKVKNAYGFAPVSPVLSKPQSTTTVSVIEPDLGEDFPFGSEVEPPTPAGQKTPSEKSSSEKPTESSQKPYTEDEKNNLSKQPQESPSIPIVNVTTPILSRPVARPAATPTIPVSTTPAPIVRKKLMPSLAQRTGEATNWGGMVPLRPITPDMHSGRRFTNLLPTQGELVLPIRGERVLKTSEEIDLESDVAEKAKKLEQLLTEIKATKGFTRTTTTSPVSIPPPVRTVPMPGMPVTPAAAVTPAVIPQQPAPVSVSTEAEKLVTNLKDENERLANEILRLKNTLDTSQKNPIESQKVADQIQNLQIQKDRTTNEYALLQKQVIDLQQRLAEKSKIDAFRATAESGPSATIPVNYAQNTGGNMPLTDKPNIISGSVEDKEGKGMPGLLLLIKDSSGEPKRAFKTNTLGQFILTTPLDNGIYTIQVSPVNNIPLSFDIISVEVSGSVLAPIKLIGK